MAITCSIRCTQYKKEALCLFFYAGYLTEIDPVKDHPAPDYPVAIGWMETFAQRMLSPLPRYGIGQEGFSVRYGNERGLMPHSISSYWLK
jgi:hypothetical protein